MAKLEFETKDKTKDSIVTPLGLESCWGFPVSHACRTEPFADRLGHIFARFCFAFSGFEDAASAPSLRTNYLPLGLESCSGFPVSHACRTEPFADRLWRILARFALLLAVSKMPLRRPVCGRITYHLHAAQSPLRTDCGTFWHALLCF